MGRAPAMAEAQKETETDRSNESRAGKAMGCMGWLPPHKLLAGPHVQNSLPGRKKAGVAELLRAPTVSCHHPA